LYNTIENRNIIFTERSGGMQIAVCDDNKYFLQELQKQLLTLPIVKNIFVFSDLRMFLSSVEDGNFYDAALMDIDWNENRTGIDAAAELYKLNPEIKIIYVTGRNDRYSQHIFLQRANLSGYLTKPVDIELLKINLQKVADTISFSEQPTITLKRNGSIVMVQLREVYFFESKGRTIETHTVGEVIVSYGRLNDIICILPPGFYQCHKSYIVNMNQIQRFQSDKILLRNGELVPVSRSKYNEAKKAFINYIGEII
jgi:DNA-binding LytR/AlgR family response regulator